MMHKQSLKALLLGALLVFAIPPVTAEDPTQIWVLDLSLDSFTDLDANGGAHVYEWVSGTTVDVYGYIYAITDCNTYSSSPSLLGQWIFIISPVASVTKVFYERTSCTFDYRIVGIDVDNRLVLQVGSGAGTSLATLNTQSLRENQSIDQLYSCALNVGSQQNTFYISSYRNVTGVTRYVTGTPFSGSGAVELWSHLDPETCTITSLASGGSGSRTPTSHFAYIESQNMLWLRGRVTTNDFMRTVPLTPGDSGTTLSDTSLGLFRHHVGSNVGYFVDNIGSGWEITNYTVTAVTGAIGNKVTVSVVEPVDAVNPTTLSGHVLDGNRHSLVTGPMNSTAEFDLAFIENATGTVLFHLAESGAGISGTSVTAQANRREGFYLFADISDDRLMIWKYVGGGFTQPLTQIIDADAEVEEVVLDEATEFDAGFIAFMTGLGFITAASQFFFALILIGVTTVVTGVLLKFMAPGKMKLILVAGSAMLIGVFAVILSLFDLWQYTLALVLGLTFIKGTTEFRNTFAEVRSMLKNKFSKKEIEGSSGDVDSAVTANGGNVSMEEVDDTPVEQDGTPIDQIEGYDSPEPTITEVDDIRPTGSGIGTVGGTNDKSYGSDVSEV